MLEKQIYIVFSDFYSVIHPNALRLRFVFIFWDSIPVRNTPLSPIIVTDFRVQTNFCWQPSTVIHLLVTSYMCNQSRCACNFIKNFGITSNFSCTSIPTPLFLHFCWNELSWPIPNQNPLTRNLDNPRDQKQGYLFI